MLSQLGAQSISHRWVGFYKNQEDAIPEWVVSAITLRLSKFGLIQLSVEFMGTFHNPLLGSNTSSLQN